MKKFRYIILALAAMFIAASCVVEDQMVTVEYNVGAANTKAMSEGESANYVWYALYDLDGNLVNDFGTKPIVDGKANCPVTMVKGQSYNIVFVAQHYSPLGEAMVPMYEIKPSQGVICMPSAARANSDEYDLFRGKDTVISYSGHKSDQVTLERIVAQVNVVSEQDDWNDLLTAGYLPDASELVLSGVPAAYDMLSGTAVDDVMTVNYTKSALTGETYNLGTAFCFAGDEISVKLGLYRGNSKIKEVTVDRAAVEPNKKTNIVGVRLL